ncbi:MAG: nucleotide-binding protein [Steroidobacteraceae bacterium]
MQKTVVERLTQFADEGEKVSSSVDAQRWSLKVGAFLEVAIGPDQKDRFFTLGVPSDDWGTLALRIGHVQGLLASAEAELNTLPAPLAGQPTIASVGPAPRIDSRKVFVVHGHDNEAKETTARFLDKLGLQPIILHEQASSGRTIIEKFETYSGDIAFAVVLLTPDDVGASAARKETLSPRARQNVIMELGYFMGSLTRVRVCALYKGGVELPSDYQGVIYIEMDGAGAWKTKLAQEFVQAKLPIDLTGLLGG